LKRIFLIMLVIVVTLSGLFLLTRQLVIENVRASSTQAIKIAEDGLQRKLVEWETDLQYLARQKAIGTLAAGVLNKSQRRASTQEIESFFIQFRRLRKDYVKSVRLFDRFGREKVVVDENGSSRDYVNVSHMPFYQRGMSQRPFQAISTLHRENDEISFEYSIPISQNGFVIGLISFGLDLNAVTNYFTHFSEVISFSHAYVYDDRAQLLFDRALKVVKTPSTKDAARAVYLEFSNSASGLAVVHSIGTLWAYVKSDALNFSFILEMENDALFEKILKLYIPVATIFLLAAFFLLFLRKRGRRLSRKGTMFVSSSSPMAQKKTSSRDGDPAVRLNDLANISNEIRGPLNNVLSMLSLLHISSLTKKQTEYLDLATRYSEWILELLNEITDFSALKKGKLKLDTIEFDVRHTLKEVSDILNVEAYKKGLEIFSLVNADVPDRMLGDPTRLRQVLVNLIGNGIKFTEQGDISVTVGVENSSKTKVVLRIEVSDTGVGIDADIAHTVFTEFEKSETIPSGDNTGVGLGLSITKQLVELLGGKIGFRENALGGSTFWLTLPYRAVLGNDALLSRGSLNGLTAFMIGESSSNRQGISKTLAHWGLTCGTSGNFESGHSILSRAENSGRPYDILIVDISASGSIEKAFELVRNIRADASICDVRIILLTAGGKAVDIDVLKDLKISACLTKPISRNNLKRALLDLNLQAKEEPKIQHLFEQEAEFPDDSVPTVLVVESNKIYQKLMIGMLARLGVATDLAENGKEAFQAIKTKPYAMLLLDAHLQDVDVIELVQRLRGYEKRLSSAKKGMNEERALGTAVVLLVNALTDKEEQIYRQGGVDELVKKPIHLERLSRLLQEWDVVDGDDFPETEIV